MSSKLAVMAAQYIEFAKGFALFTLVLAPPSWAKEFMDGFPFLGPCCDHYFQDETEETRVLKGHVFWVLSTAVTTVVNHQIGLTACDLIKFPRPGWLAYPQVEVRGVQCRTQDRRRHFLSTHKNVVYLAF